MNPIYQRIKEEQKDRALRIRKAKSLRKDAAYEAATDDEKQFALPDWQIRKLGQEYRHWHIAICERRGRTRDQIESPREDNLPNEKEIERIKQQVDQEVAEAQEMQEVSNG